MGSTFLAATTSSRANRRRPGGGRHDRQCPTRVRLPRALLLLRRRVRPGQGEGPFRYPGRPGLQPQRELRLRTLQDGTRGHRLQVAGRQLLRAVREWSAWASAELSIFSSNPPTTGRQGETRKWSLRDERAFPRETTETAGENNCVDELFRDAAACSKSELPSPQAPHRGS